jgi:hypothetical protein
VVKPCDFWEVSEDRSPPIIGSPRKATTGGVYVGDINEEGESSEEGN